MRSLSSCCLPAFQPETSCRYPVTRLTCTTSCEPHSGQTACTAERAVLDARDDLVVAVAVVERAHQFKVRLAAVGTGILVNNQVAGVTLVFALFFRNIIQSFVFICYFLLFRCPIHTITLHRSLINI